MLLVPGSSMTINVGDLVRTKSKDDNDRIGIVSDCLDHDSGHFYFEVIFETDRGWFGDLELEKIDSV
jgi:hypothetical protein